MRMQKEAGGAAASDGISGLRLSPAQALLLLCAASQLLFTIHLGRPAQPFFDETHYVPAARSIIGGLEYTNIEHPPFAKFLIGLSIAWFGDTPYGWRLLGSLMGTVTLAGVFGVAHALFRDIRISVHASIFALLGQFLFVQARVAMLDVYMSGFMLPAIYLLIDAHRGGRVRAKLAGSGLLFGLAVACKWAAAPYLGLAGLLFLLVRLRSGASAWPGVSTLGGLSLLGVLAVLAYLLSFAPVFFVERNALTLATLLPQQLEIYQRQTQPLAPHTYMSNWWAWPLIGRPIWYLYEQVQGVQRGVLLIGNPAIMWGGLVAVLACLVAGLRGRDPRLLLAAGLFLFSYGIWIVIPKKIGFYYYYYLPALFLSIALAAAFGRLRAGKLRWLPAAFTAVAAGLFVYFYPIISAAPLPNDQAFLNWTWFETWK